MGAALALGACGLGAGGRNTAAVVGTGGLVGEPLSGRMHCGEKITIYQGGTHHFNKSNNTKIN